MARTTRSSVQALEKDKQTESPAVSRTKSMSKKRKRPSAGDGDGHTQKQLRASLNGDTGHDMVADADLNPQEDSKPSPLPYAGDVPITSDNARKILDILEMIDTQGLLDRVFPLPSHPSGSSVVKMETTSDSSYSLRTLLKEASEHPLSVLRSAIQHLFPITYHPRSRSSTPAAQQLRFCNLALSLLDQASLHSIPILPDLEAFLPLSFSTPGPDVKEATSDSTIRPPSSPHRRKYALMQRLPTGDWWTSLNSGFSVSSGDLKTLSTSHAELVAILPTPSSSLQPDLTKVPTLGSYTPKNAAISKLKMPKARHVSCGSFLDYGPYASFAPSFDQEGREIGRAQLGEVFSDREVRKRKRALEALQEITNSNHDVAEDEDVEMTQPPTEEPPPNEGTKCTIEESLSGLLTKGQVAEVMSALDTIELQEAAVGLLERNCKALERLERLQVERLAGPNGGTSEVEVGSEEWDTAQGIMDTLTVLTSLRPRSSMDEQSPLVPLPAVLHKLHRTLPLSPSQGWYGTLPSTRKFSLRDDSTLRIRSGATAVQPTTVTPTNTTLAMPTPSQPYAYTYTPYAAQQYRGGYMPYKAGQATSFYPSTFTSQAAGTVSGQNQTTAGASYYSQYAAAGQQTYSYGPWYNYQPQTVVGAGGGGTTTASTSGRGTPQPIAGRSTPTQPTPQRAVANTVLTKHLMAAGSRAGAAASTATAASTSPGYVPPTLPAHLRGATVAAVNPASPSNVTGYQPTAYYQAPATPATSR